MTELIENKRYMGGVHVIRILPPTVVDIPMVGKVGAAILEYVHRLPDPAQKVVIDMSKVQTISSALVGQCINATIKLKSEGHHPLVFADMNEDTLGVFSLVGKSERLGFAPFKDFSPQRSLAATLAALGAGAQIEETGVNAVVPNAAAPNREADRAG